MDYDCTITKSQAEEFEDAFENISGAVHNNARSKGWWDESRNDGELIALMHAELSEALEGLRKPREDDHCPEFDNIEVELADTIIRIMDYSYARGYRVGRALIAKAEYNRTRSYKHGGKEF